MKRFALAVLLVSFAAVSAEDKIQVRYKIEADNDLYPQKTAQDTLRSVLKAIDARRIDYVLAHLADPAFVDQRVKDVGSRFDVMVQETTRKLDADPEMLRELRRFLADGEWQEQADAASVKCKEVRGKMVYFKKIGNRWFLENRTTPATA